MNILSIIAVFVGGGLGSLCRFGISRLFVASSYVQKFPFATLISNVFSCAVLAAVIYLTARSRLLNEHWNIFWIIGFCGGFSTFSTFSYENWLLYREASFALLTINILLNLALCLGIFVLAAKSFSVSGG